MPEKVEKVKKEKKTKKKSTKSSKKSRHGEGATVVTLADDSTGVVHAFSEQEKAGIVDHLNEIMSGHEGFEGINPNSMEIFERVRDGTLLCHAVNGVVPGTVPTRRITAKKKMNRFEINENIDAALDGCRALKLQIVNVGAEDIVGGTAFHLVLGVLWQLVRLDLLNAVSRAKHHMKGVLGDVDLDALVPEQVLLMWVNYHLQAAESERRCKNFSSDIADSEVYTVLLHQLDKRRFSLAPMDQADLTARAELVLKEAAKQDLDKFINANDIVSGNARLNFAFVANLFNHFQSEEIDDDDIDDEPEEDDEEIGGWREDLNELEAELYEKERAQAEADERLAALKAQRDEARRQHQSEVDRLTAELEAMAMAEPKTAEERALADKLAEEERIKLALASRQTNLLRKAADLADKLDDNEDEARALVEARQQAEADIREFKRNHKNDMLSVRRRLAQAKLEQEMLESELDRQTEERNKLKEERHSLARKYKDLSVKLEVETIDRIQTQSAKDKLDRQLFHAKKYLTEAKVDKKIKEKKKKVLTREVRKLKEKHDMIATEKKKVELEVSMLAEENRDLTSEITNEHENVLRSRNVRRALEETVGALKQQLDEDEEFHIAVREQTAAKHEKETVDLAKQVVRDLDRKQQLLEISKQDAQELEEQARKTAAVAAKLAESTALMLEQTEELEASAAVVDSEKAAIEKKRRKLEKQLRKARRLISDQSKSASEVEQKKRMAAKKLKQVELDTEAARKAAEEAERVRRVIELEALEAAEAIEVETLERQAVAREAQLLAMEAEELEMERARVVMEKERVLSKLADEARNERVRLEEEAAAMLESQHAERKELTELATVQELELEEERAQKAMTLLQTEERLRLATELKRDADTHGALADAHAEEARELREAAREEREAARWEKQQREALEKETAELEAVAAKAKEEMDLAERQREELARRVARLEEEEAAVHLESAAMRSDQSAQREALADMADRERRRAAEEARLAGKLAADELRSQGRTDLSIARQEAERLRLKEEQKTKSLEERLAEADAQLEAELRRQRTAEKAQAIVDAGGVVRDGVGNGDIVKGDGSEEDSKGDQNGHDLDVEEDL